MASLEFDRETTASRHRSLQRFHFRGRQAMGSHQEGRRGERLRLSHAVVADSGAENWSSDLLCDAS